MLAVLIRGMITLFQSVAGGYCSTGNEVVGPTATMEAAWLLLRAATCAQNSASPDCTVDGILTDHPERIAWLARLVATRSIYMMPMTNAMGFWGGSREENGIDPNRDFPYHQDGQCMRV